LGFSGAGGGAALRLTYGLNRLETKGRRRGKRKRDCDRHLGRQNCLGKSIIRLIHGRINSSSSPRIRDVRLVMLALLVGGAIIYHLMHPEQCDPSEKLRSWSALPQGATPKSSATVTSTATPTGDSLDSSPRYHDPALLTCYDQSLTAAITKFSTGLGRPKPDRRRTQKQRCSAEGPMAHGLWCTGLRLTEDGSYTARYTSWPVVHSGEASVRAQVGTGYCAGLEN
jgi:hypothetical protein